MATEKPKAATLSAWTESATHYPMLPSGTRVGIRIPDLPALIASGGIPQHLLEIAIGSSGDAPTPSVELMKEQVEFTDTLVQTTVVEPKIPEGKVAGIPYEDKLFLVEIATRQRDLDALGDHIGGLPTAKKWEPFRGGDDGDAALED